MIICYRDVLKNAQLKKRGGLAVHENYAICSVDLLDLIVQDALMRGWGLISPNCLFYENNQYPHPRIY